MLLLVLQTRVEVLSSITSHARNEVISMFGKKITKLQNWSMSQDVLKVLALCASFSYRIFSHISKSVYIRGLMLITMKCTGHRKK